MPTPNADAVAAADSPEMFSPAWIAADAIYTQVGLILASGFPLIPETKDSFARIIQDKMAPAQAEAVEAGYKEGYVTGGKQCGNNSHNYQRHLQSWKNVDWPFSQAHAALAPDGVEGGGR